MWLNILNITGKSKLFPQEPPYIHIQATCYRVAEFKQANKVFFSGSSFTSKQPFVIAKKRSMTLSFTSKGNLTMHCINSEIIQHREIFHSS